MDFAETGMRHRCRNLRCRSRLKAPVSNPREAFCVRGCHTQFYRKRCIVCEKDLEQKYRKLKPKEAGGAVKFIKVPNPSPVCGSSECKRRWRDKDGLGCFSPSRTARPYRGSLPSDLRKETTAAQAPFSAIAARFSQIAGPPLTPEQFRAVTIPDGPNGRWEGGEFERTEARNRALLKAHFARLAKDCLIQPHHPPVNILGGHRFPDAPAIDMSATTPRESGFFGSLDPPPGGLQVLARDMHADLSIPDFLLRA
jgi:hypothetical protein